MASCTNGSKRLAETTSQAPQLHFSGNLSRVSDQNLGESADELKMNLGEPSETGTEKYEGVEFQTFDYKSTSGTPLAFFTINSNGEVIGKSFWISKDQQESNLNWLLRNRFAGIKFENYTPCKTHGLEQMLIARDQGLFIGIDGQQVLFISNGSRQLTDIRIKQYEIVCPQLQERGHIKR
jgi:hypothetical protein